MPYPDLINDSVMAEIQRRITAPDNEQRVTDSTAGESVFDRAPQFNGTAVTSQDLSLVGFTARTTQTISQIRVASATTAAGATPTVIQFGVYVRDTSNNYIQVASTPHDATLLAAANTIYNKSFTTPFTKVANQDYLVGLLIVSAAAMPTLAAPTSAVIAAWQTNVHLLQPIVCGKIAAQAALPTSFLASSVVGSAGIFHAVLLA